MFEKEHIRYFYLKACTRGSILGCDGNDGTTGLGAMPVREPIENGVFPRDPGTAASFPGFCFRWSAIVWIKIKHVKYEVKKEYFSIRHHAPPNCHIPMFLGPWYLGKNPKLACILHTWLQNEYVFST